MTGAFTDLLVVLRGAGDLATGVAWRLKRSGSLVRGLVAGGTRASKGLKIGDVDPRTDTDWRQISDKALAVAGGVLEAVLTWLCRCASEEKSPG